ncbi:MAG: type IV pilus secretin PilQ [Deltaproteobacteria bacterium]|nr:type IV pilus secretin PilQ [Deltaproteobacteria bacterium]
MRRFGSLMILAMLLWALSGCAANPDQAPSTASPTPQAAAAGQAAPAKTPSTASARANLQELSVREERGQTTLLIKLARPITQYRHFPLPQPARVVLDIPTDSAGAAATDTYRIDTSIVSVLRLSSGENNLRLTVEVAAATVPPYTITQEEGGVKIVVGAVDANVNTKRNMTLVQAGQRMDVRTVQQAPAPTPGADKRPPTPATDDKPSTDKTYTGQKISLDFKDADIKNVFRLLAEVSGLNLVVTADVNRRVTLRLVEVPWDQAMDLIITTNGLDKEQLGNVVRISTAGALKAEKDALIAARKSKEDLEPLLTTYYNINYAKAKDLEPKVKSLMSKRPENAIVVDERSNTIMVRDIQKSVDDIAVLIGKLDLRTSQILIESNLVETSPTFSRALGLELDSVFNNGRIIASSRFLAGSPFAGAAQSPTVGTNPFLVIPNSGFRFGTFQKDIGPVLSAAENEGLVKIISRPSVTTLNNVPSTIKSERILRILTPSSTNIASGSGAAAGGAVATEKIPVGITLTVVPQVSSDGFVLMNIKVKSSSIANSPTVSGGVGGVVPFDELNREAEANVLVRDGETIVLGGILKDTDQNSTSGVPFLKDIPYIGWLFKNWRVQKDFEELIVFITPRIAAAGSEHLPSAEQIWREQMKQTQGSAEPPPPPVVR